MHAKSDTRAGADRLIAELACRQHGVVARRQLLEAGLSSTMISWRIRDARLHPIHRGVYLVGHRAPLPHARELAALLACGDGAVLSHRSAASAWELLPYPATARVCVTVPTARSTRRPGIRVHRAAVDTRDVRHRHRLRLSSPPRTILDLGAELREEELERLVAEANYRRLASDNELREQLTRNPGKRGSAALREVLDLPGGPQRTRSPAERTMLRLLREAGVTGFQFNQGIHGYEVDILWRELHFALEIDGYAGHSGRIAFERDRLKTSSLIAHGLSVMQVTPRQLDIEPLAVVARLAHALELARARLAD